ncbi:hypothetical protein [Blautia acetigignens]|nr:hypothetical protein [Blautia acetigignens]
MQIAGTAFNSQRSPRCAGTDGWRISGIW